MTNILLVIHVLAAIAIVILVLLQQGRGADMGAAFGGGSGTLFGARGSANFLSRVTGVLAAIFFFTSLSLAYIYGTATEPTSVTEQIIQQEENTDEAGELPPSPDSATSESNQEQSDIPSVPDSDEENKQE